MVEGVNNSNNHAGLYSAGAAVIGGGAAAAAGWYSRPFLKDGAPTDSFLKKTESKLLEKAGDDDFVKDYKNMKKSQEAFDNIKDMDGLKQFLKNDEYVQGILKEVGADVNEGLKEIEADGFEKSMKEFRENLVKPVSESIDEFKGLVKSTVSKAWDKDAKKFVYNKNDITKEAFEAITDTAKSIQGKYAAIYGAIGAGVLGLGTYLCLHGKKQEPPKEAAEANSKI